MCILAIEEILATQLHESWFTTLAKKQGDLTSPSESLTIVYINNESPGLVSCVWDSFFYNKKQIQNALT